MAKGDAKKLTYTYIIITIKHHDPSVPPWDFECFGRSNGNLWISHIIHDNKATLKQCCLTESGPYLFENSSVGLLTWQGFCGLCYMWYRECIHARWWVQGHIEKIGFLQSWREQWTTGNSWNGILGLVSYIYTSISSSLPDDTELCVFGTEYNQKWLITNTLHSHLISECVAIPVCRSRSFHLCESAWSLPT